MRPVPGARAQCRYRQLRSKSPQRLLMRCPPGVADRARKPRWLPAAADDTPAAHKRRPNVCLRSCPFRSEHHWIGYTPACGLKVASNTGTLDFECLWMNVDDDSIGA